MKIRGQTVIPLKERISALSKIDAPSGCWNWIGTTRNGYGRLIVGSRTDATRRSVSAHRASYEVWIGMVPAGWEICHRCDNRLCVNPAHLFAGTRQDNIDDREAKGRNNPPRGIKQPHAKLDDVSVISARRLRNHGWIYQSIANRFGVHKKTAMDAVKGRSWNHIPTPPAPKETRT